MDDDDDVSRSQVGMSRRRVETGVGGKVIAREDVDELFGSERAEEGLV